MDPLSLTASVVAIVQITGECMKLAKIGPSKYHLARLKQINTDLYGFYGTINNLQLHLKICEEDQARLSALDHLQEPLSRCLEALKLLKTRFEHDGVFTQYVMGLRFDKKLEDCLRVIADAKSLLELALLCDQRFATSAVAENVMLTRYRVIINAVETYVRNTAEETRNIQNAIASTERVLAGIQSQVKQSSELTMTLREAQSQGLAKVHGAVGNLTLEIKAQETKALLQKQVARRSAALGWLSSMDIRSNYLDVLRAREPGTGKWLISHPLFQFLINGELQALWLHGMPGAGKTFLSAAAIDHLERSSTSTIAYFFFDFKDSEKQLTEAMIRSVAAQLENEASPHCLSPELECLYSKCCGSGKNREPTLDEAVNLLISYSVGESSTYLVLDALDECRDRVNLISVLRKLREIAPNIKLFVTSRRETDLVDGLTEDRFQGSPIEGDALMDNIRLYIRSTLANDRLLQKLPEDLKDHIQRTLVEGSQFRWVRCQIDVIRSLKRPKAIKEALRKLPKTLDETYERILLQLSETGSEDSTDLLRKIFIFLAFGKRPMTLPELAQAIIIDVGGREFDDDNAFHNPEDLLTLCQPLVALSSTTGYLGFVHYSVQEFLLSDRLAKAGSEISMYALDPKTSHTEIARICLSFLNYDDFASGPCTSYEDFQSRTAKFPFLAYAASEWPDHATEQDVETELTSSISQLLIPQKNPKLASMFQNSWEFGEARGDDVTLFCTYLAEDGTERMYESSYMVNSLTFAAVVGLDSVLARIDESGADINLPGGHAGNALQCAACYGRLTTAKILLDLGADASFDKGDYGRGTPLKIAIISGQRQMIDFFLDWGVDVNVGGEEYHKLLKVAAGENDVPTMQRLIEAGADIHHGEDQDAPWKDPYDGVTALETAVSRGNIEAALFLIEQGASLGDFSITAMADCLCNVWRGEGMPIKRVETLMKGLAALGHHVEVDDEVEEGKVEEAEEAFCYEKAGLNQRSRPVKFRLKIDRASSDMDRCGA
ncbi:hypothetical protein A1O7_10073 [Cladophialophora yegresii CBS 114405]|uniref:Uncharacterized protein n=1 Tax=Cladophialophora yegresii CBS 114405 TaxID=1182544 RepID=W9VGH2_9EURO|nr:uncharacterized protein A1O7_10073 [Cladophialophora yegresii CBS 114405]EXJ54732.1 hypothetical protein A1O7_10073 [Cladophialophora yegresii CBS 114405]